MGNSSVLPPPLSREQKLVAAIGPPPVAQVAPIPRVLQVHHPTMEPIQHQQLTPIVDMHGAPMLDAATGHPLVAAPVQQQQYLAGADMGLYTVQPGAPLQLMAQVPAMLAQQPQQQQMMVVQPQAQQQTAPPPPIQIEVAPPQQQQQQQQPQQQQQQPQQQQQQHADAQPAGGTYGIWTSKPLVTMNMLTAMAGSRHAVQNSAVEVEPLPDGICVSRFGPISRKPVQMKNYSEPTAVTAGFGLHTRSTSTIRQPLPATSPVPENMLVVQDQHSILQFPETAAVYEYDPGFYTEFVHSNIREGMESVSMSHLVHPPYTPISPLPDPRDQTASSVRHNSQSLTMAAESARIQKELADLQRRISCLSVAENSNQMAMKRDRLAIELRMIESGIRDRQNEICQNQTFPHADTRDEISTEYTYW